MRYRLILLCVPGLLAFPSCGRQQLDAPTEPHPSIEFDRATFDPKVENGTVFDTGSVAITGYEAIAVSEGTRVVQEGDGALVQVFMAKRLYFSGHPPQSIRLRHVRRNMGCATKPDGPTLWIGTFGEFDTRDGGAKLNLLVVVPNGTRVERGSMPKPATPNGLGEGEYLTKPREVTDGYWYGPVSPAAGWVAVPDTPDPTRRAAQSGG